MAPPTDINQNLPDTLPSDFGDWDGDESPAAGTLESTKVESPKVESGDMGPRTAANAVARQSVPTASRPAPSREATARELAPRLVDGERNTAPIPRSPLGPPPANPRAYATPSAKGPRPVAQPSGNHPEDDVFFRRIRSLNTVVDKLPAVPQASEQTASAAVVTLPPPAVKEQPVNQTEEAAQPLSFRTDLSEPEDEEERRAKRKWMAIIGVGVGVVALVLFQLFRYGTLSQVRHMVAVPSTTTLSSEPLPETTAPEETSPEHPLPGKSAAESSKASSSDAAQDDTSTHSGPAPVQSKMMREQLLAPARIPQGAKMGASNDAPPADGFTGANMAGLAGNNNANISVFNGSGQSKTPQVALKSVTVSAGVATGMLIHKTQPIYPSIAKAARVTGTVVIQATISKTGAVVNPRVVSGPVMLRQAALDAVKTWRYRPYKLNNEPTDVDTTVNIVFALGT